MPQVSKRLRKPCSRSTDLTELPHLCNAQLRLDTLPQRQTVGWGQELGDGSGSCAELRKSSAVEAVVSAGYELSKSVDAIESCDAKKSFDDTEAFDEELAGVKSLRMPLQVQNEFTKSVLETFVSGSAKYRESLRRYC